MEMADEFDSACPQFLCLDGVLRSWRLGVLARDYTLPPVTENAIAKKIVHAAFRIHTTHAPCLQESANHVCSPMNLLSADYAQ
jgi:hypothetical protein